jgi:hypothetical protein
MKWLAVLTTLVLALSCGPGQAAYQDRVRSLGSDEAHPLYNQLLPLMARPETTDPDSLVRTWKEFLGDAPLPLRADGTFTFVYYDFSHSLDQVFLEASFAPGRREPLNRVGKSFLYVRVYAIPKPAQATYRFSDGKNPLVDPFHSDLEPGTDFWQPLVTPLAGAASVQWVSGTSEASLGGQDLIVLLPPSYRMNLAQTYPLVLVTGLEGTSWTSTLAAVMEDGSTRPFIAVSVGTVAGLKAVMEDRVVPFVRRHYRVSPLASETVLVGWGTMAKATQEMASGRPDFWNKTWITPDQARNLTAWSNLAPAYFRTLFAVVAP